MDAVNPARGSALRGGVWMVVISIVLFWLPGIGGFVGGLVGGKTAGGVGAALLAWLLSSILFAVLFAALGTALTGLVVIGALAGVGGLVIATVDSGARLLGAIIGGMLA